MEICLGLLCLGPISVIVYLLGDVGVRKGYESKARRSYSKARKSK